MEETIEESTIDSYFPLEALQALVLQLVKWIKSLSLSFMG